MDEGTGRFRRKQIVIDRSFQFQYMIVWVLTGIGVVMLGIAVYALWKAGGGGRNPQFAGPVIKTAVGMGVFVLLFCALMGVLSVYLTHRVAGAAYRLQKTLRTVSEGDLNQQFQLRKNDYLQDLAAELNAFVAALRQQRDQLAEVSQSLQKAVEALRSSGKLQDQELGELQAALAKLDSLCRPPKTG